MSAILLKNPVFALEMRTIIDIIYPVCYDSPSNYTGFEDGENYVQAIHPICI